jgi:hypothetical protein
VVLVHSWATSQAAEAIQNGDPPDPFPERGSALSDGISLRGSDGRALLSMGAMVEFAAGGVRGVATSAKEADELVVVWLLRRFSRT